MSAKLKKSREARVCHQCGASIAKGDLYRPRTITVCSDPQGESINGGKDWHAFRLTKKIHLCQDCA